MADFFFLKIFLLHVIITHEEVDIVKFDSNKIKSLHQNVVKMTNLKKSHCGDIASL